MNARVHVFVSGKVQGVFFRSSTKNKADELGLSGWVKNLQDGRVDCL
jgi:acylphosphatase